jgi:hypothetical protein
VDAREWWPGSGIFKSTDGGDTWTELTRNPGLPRGTIGKSASLFRLRIPIAFGPLSKRRRRRVSFRQRRRTWTRVNEERRLRQRAWYYTRIYADPKNADTFTF